MTQLYDTVLVDAASVRRTADGYLVAQPRVARTGIQVYAGRECGRPDMERVRVYRPEAEVFSPDALHSFAHRPVTNDHPAVPVTADNWRAFAVGQTGDEVVRDGNTVRVPMVLMDAGAIKAFEDGKRELSMGYACDLKWEPGVTADGEQYDAIQTGIRANHLALVKTARGGAELRIGDEEDSEHGDFVKIGPDQYKRKGGKGKVYSYAQVKAYYSSGGWDAATFPADADIEIGDYNPNHYPSGQAGGRGGQFAPAKFSSAGEAKEVLKKERKRLASATVIERTEEIVEPATGLGRLLGMKRRKKERHYEIKVPDSADVVDADDLDISDDDNTGEIQMKTMVVDGITCEMSDTAIQVVQRALDNAAAETKRLKDQYGQLEEEAKKNKKKMEEDSATFTTQLATKDAENATLKKQVADSAITPAKLDQMVRDRAEIIGKAKVLLGDKLVVDGKTDLEIRRQVVDAKMGDAAKGWNEDQVAASFAALTFDAKPGVTDLARSFATGTHTVDKRDQAYDGYRSDISAAWKGTQHKTA